VNNPFNYLPLFSLSLIFGIAMIIEGFLIVKLRKQIIPLPSRVLYWIGVGLIGKEKSTQKFTGKTTPENLRTYAVIALIFGVSVVISSFVYLNSILS
jgi:hypothetical protein